MTRDEFNAFCSSLPATHRVIQWGGAHVWKVGPKIFALFAPWGWRHGEDAWSLAFKASDLGFEILCEQDGIDPAPYLGRYKWVQVHDPSALTIDECEDYIKNAHTLVSAKLTKAQKKDLGLTNPQEH